MENIKDFSLEAAKKYVLSHFQGTFDDYPEGGKMSAELLKSVLAVAVLAGYKFGVRSQKEQSGWTDKDVIMFALKCCNDGWDPIVLMLSQHNSNYNHT